MNFLFPCILMKKKTVASAQQVSHTFEIEVSIFVDAARVDAAGRFDQVTNPGVAASRITGQGTRRQVPL